MAGGLRDLLAVIDAEHRRLDDLSAQTVALLGTIECDATAVIPAPCRQKISVLVGQTLKTCVAHFMHEYEIMHYITAPKSYIDSHADEHDALLVQLRVLVEHITHGTAGRALLDDIEAFDTAVKRHRDTADADLYRYLAVIT